MAVTGRVSAKRVMGKVSTLLTVGVGDLQQKEVTPTKETQHIKADEDYGALSEVTVKPIPDEYIVPSGNQSITENGAYDVTNKASVTVRVVDGDYVPILQDKSATPTETQQKFSADDDYDGIGTFTVEPIPSEYIIPSGTIEITESGTYDVTDKASAVVNVSGGDLVGYSGSQWQGTIGAADTTPITINVGAEIPEKFYFNAWSAAYITYTNAVFDVKQYVDGTQYARYNYVPPAGGLSHKTEEMTNKIAVSADRKSITIGSPNTTGFIGGTWEWMLVVVEG
jgi:hypothetical protein